jgi:hypothetical protein
MSSEEFGQVIHLYYKTSDAEVELCQPCWEEQDGLGVLAHYLVSDVPMCQEHYFRVCHRCCRQWATTLKYGSEFTYVCDGCNAVLKRLEARRKVYNEHLESKGWRKTKKTLRREIVREHGRAICSRCQMTEHDNKREYGEGLHGHHRTYENFGHEQAGDVELLCSRCHAWEHRLPAPKSINISSGFSHFLKRGK